MEDNYTITVVPGIHWDRSWRCTFQEYRIELVKCIDRLIEVLNKDRRYAVFTFGGQSVSIEDYLEIYPHMKRELKRLIQDGRIDAGPWYTLPDVFLVSPESLIRNLMMGHIISESFGGVMKVGYIPDSSGQISQLPQILQDFGIDAVIFSHGVGDEGQRIGSKFIWQSPDGVNKVLAFHHLSIDYSLEKIFSEDASQEIQRIINEAKDQIDTASILLNEGNNLAMPECGTTDVIEQINEEISKIEVTHSSFPEFIESIKSSDELEKYEGEFRSSRYKLLMPGVTSARIYIKQANESIQTLMERWVEPFSTISWIETDGNYPDEFIWYAWRELLKNHSHNNIRGCCIDEVHDEDMVRYGWVQQVGENLTSKALNNIIGGINFPPISDQPIVVFNPLAWERTDPVTFESKFLSISENIMIKNAEGEIIPSQTSHGEDGISRISFDGIIPALGYSTYYLSTSLKTDDDTSDQFKIGSRHMENRFYRIKINTNGTLDILDKSTGSEYKGCNLFEDSEDGGDTYDYFSVRHGRTITSKTNKANIKFIEEGPVRAVVEIKSSINLPKELTKDRENRTMAKLSCNITTNVTIYANYPRIDFATTFDNKVNDHRLRVVFPVDMKTDSISVDGHFDVLDRAIDMPKPEVQWAQNPVPTNHQGIFLDISDGKRGFALVNRGLPEYEIRKSRSGCRIYLTLLRCVGWLSRDDITSRHQSLGLDNMEASKAQCPGTHGFSYSLILHKGNWESAKILRMAQEHNVPCRAIYAEGYEKANPDLKVLPHTQSFISIEPANLVLSALKKCELGDGIILRLYNPTKHDVRGTIRTYRPLKSAYLTNMNEELLVDEELDIDDDGVIHLIVGKHGIKTMELKF